jgi:outer membrane immunogenic protein
MKTGFGWALASAMLLGSIGSAVAADMPMKAMPMKAPPVAVYNWTGFYIGGSVGGIWNDTRSDTYPTGCFLTNVACGGGAVNNPIRSDSARLNDSRFIGGGQAGYNWQSGRFVGGVEGDISWTGLNQSIITTKVLSAPLVGSMVHGDSMKQDWLATLRARAGFTLAPQFLIYATGGLAFGHVQTASAVAFTATTDAYAGATDDTRVGWTVGVGGEWMIAPKWSIKAEYLYVDLGKLGTNQPCITAVCTAFAPPPSYQADYRIHENIARVGVDYHFGGPVVARY